MAAPTITRTGTGQSKTSGLTLAVTLTSTAYALNDYVRVTFGSDPTTGAISFSKAGTATIGAFTNQVDAKVGSGTAGSRIVTAWAKVTAAGTITSITATMPTTTAKAAEVYKISGAAGTTPVVCSIGLSSLTVAGTNGKDCLAIGSNSYELASGATSTQVVDTGWSSSLNETTSFGTTGGTGNTNISVSTLGETILASAEDGNSINPFDQSVSVVASEIWVAAAAAATVYPGPPTVVLRSVMRASMF